MLESNVETSAIHSFVLGLRHENAIRCLCVAGPSLLRDGAAAVGFADRSDAAGDNASDPGSGNEFDFAADVVGDVDVSARGAAAR